MWESDHKEGWTWCFWVMVLKKTLEIPLESKETKAVNPKGNKFWIFIRMTVAEAKAPILWSPDAKSWLIKKDPGLENTELGREWNERGLDGWLASLIQWTWVWAISGRQRRKGKSGMLQSMGSQSVGHHWETEQQ